MVTYLPRVADGELEAKMRSVGGVLIEGPKACGKTATASQRAETVFDMDYITVAQAKGMPNQRVLWRYAARNAVLPQIQSFALSIGFIVGGTIVMEMVFSYPGVGKLLLDATNAKDYALMQGVFLVITLSVLVANILADIAYAFLDPRTRQTEA